MKDKPLNLDLLRSKLSELSVADFGKKGTFAIYPNPTKGDKKVNILFDLKEAALKTEVSKYLTFSVKKYMKQLS